MSITHVPSSALRVVGRYFCGDVSLLAVLGLQLRLLDARYLAAWGAWGP